MRLDKYLKVSRIVKRRTVANEICDAKHASVNGAAKALYCRKIKSVLCEILRLRLRMTWEHKTRRGDARIARRSFH